MFPRHSLMKLFGKSDFCADKVVRMRKHAP